MSRSRASTSSTEPRTPTLLPEHLLAMKHHGVFARLVPCNQTACEAFNDAANAIEESDQYRHCLQFISLRPKAARACSVFTEDELNAEESQRQKCLWQGCYVVSLQTPPQEPARGWCLGIGGSESAVADLLLAPPHKRWKETGIAQRHAYLYFHLGTGQVMIEARHTLIVGGAHGPSTITGHESCVLEQGELLSIGDCLYQFELTGPVENPTFDVDLPDWLLERYGVVWTPPPRMLGPGLGEATVRLGPYTFPVGALAQGSGGQMLAGWDPQGAAVAVKRLRSPGPQIVRKHRRMMKFLGDHVRPTSIQVRQAMTVCTTGQHPQASVHQPFQPGSTECLLRLYTADQRKFSRCFPAP